MYAIKNGDRITNDIATWNSNSQIIENLTVNDIWHRRSNLNGIVLTDVLLSHELIQIYSKVDEDGNVDAKGYTVDVMNMLMKQMNFTRKVIQPPDGQWGVLKENGHFNGIVGQLQQGLGDFSSAGLTIVLERSLAIDYSTTFYQGILTMVTKATSGKPTMDYLVYVGIFSVRVWVLYISSTCLGVGILYSISKLKIERFHSVNDYEDFGFFNALALGFLIFLQLEYSITKKSLITKLVFMTMCFSSFLIFSYYSADLTSLMTSGPAPSHIRSFSDVFNSDLSLAVEQGTAYETIIE